MADNTTLNPGTGGDTIATDDIAGTKYQRVKLVDGTADSTAAIGGDATNGLDVDVTRLPALPAGSNNIGDVDVLTAPGTAADGAGAQPAVVYVIAGFDGTNVQTITTNAAGNLQVGLSAALPAGTNNIGDVDVLTLPALPAGTNNIGDVDVLTLPALPAGNNNIGDVDVVTLPALAAGTNAIGKLSANSGVDIGDVDVTSISAGTNAIGNVGLTPRTSGGLTLSRTISAASTNATSVKASAGQVFWMYLSNINAAVRYLKFYNKASAPTVGSDTPVLTLAIPGNTAGAGAVIPADIGLAFGTGIAFAITTGVTDADTGAVAANEIVVNLGYA